jgi:hypothetical protein
MTSTIYCFIFSAIGIHSSVPMDLVYHGCMSVAIVSIEMCVSVNGTNKCVGEIQYSTKLTWYE